MAQLALTHIGNAGVLGRKFLVPELDDVLRVRGDHPREADHLPAGLIAVTAIDRIGKHTFDYGLIHGAPEHAYRQAAAEADFCR